MNDSYDYVNLSVGSLTVRVPKAVLAHATLGKIDQANKMIKRNKRLTWLYYAATGLITVLVAGLSIYSNGFNWSSGELFATILSLLLVLIVQYAASQYNQVTVLTKDSEGDSQYKRAHLAAMVIIDSFTVIEADDKIRKAFLACAFVSLFLLAFEQPSGILSSVVSIWFVVVSWTMDRYPERFAKSFSLVLPSTHLVKQKS